MLTMNEYNEGPLKSKMSIMSKNIIVLDPGNEIAPDVYDLIRKKGFRIQNIENHHSLMAELEISNGTESAAQWLICTHQAIQNEADQLDLFSFAESVKSKSPSTLILLVGGPKAEIYLPGIYRLWLKPPIRGSMILSSMAPRLFTT